MCVGYEYEVYHAIIHSGKRTHAAGTTTRYQQGQSPANGKSSKIPRSKKSKNLKSLFYQGALRRSLWTTMLTSFSSDASKSLAALCA